ncbi:MAG: efflux RND transporter periplasmic adaptor subunit [Abditibacteriota bacterium]|nr:efflux RND transporter periplasmic adaptor subunit [Abditibacteriota bacterium]
MSKKLIAGIIIIVVVVGGLIGFSIARRPAAKAKTIDENQKENGYPVSLETLRNGDIDQFVSLTGKISALDKQVITSKVGGKVARVNVREGEPVRAGQVLVELESEDYVNALRSAESNLKQARAQLQTGITDKKNAVISNDVTVKNAKASVKGAEQALELAKKPFKTHEIIQAENAVNSAKQQLEKAKADEARYKALCDKGAVSRSDYESMSLAAVLAQNTYDSAVEAYENLKDQGRQESIVQAEQALEMAKQNLRSAEANAQAVVMKDDTIRVLQTSVDIAKTAVDTAQYNLSNTKIVSKINGVLSTRTVEPGQTIGAGSSLGEVVSDTQLFYLADLSEVDVRNVKQGQLVDVTLDAVPGRVFTGHVAAIYPVADSATRMFPVRVVLENDAKIRSGMFAKGKVETGQHTNVLLVPNGALVRADGDVAVFKAVEDGTKAQKILVEVVSADDLNSEVRVLTGSLKAGDSIVVNGKDSLSDESKIYIDKK